MENFVLVGRFCVVCVEVEYSGQDLLEVRSGAVHVRSEFWTGTRGPVHSSGQDLQVGTPSGSGPDWSIVECGQSP